MKRSNPAFSNEIATHLSGARNDKLGKSFCFLSRDLGRSFKLTRERFLDKVHPELRDAAVVLIMMRIRTFFSRHLSPARIFVLSFARGILLWVPFSATKGHLC